MKMFDPVVETLDPGEQFKLDRDQYAVQLEYLFKNSAFYQKKLAEAGIHNAGEAGPLEHIAELPFTEKDELRRTQAEQPPFGTHLACDQAQLVRVFSTSGTTGVPCFIGLTRNDLDMYATNVARGYTAAGFTPAHRLVVGFNAGPFVAGAVYYGFDKIGCTVAPIGTGNTERLLTSIQRLSATGISCTPSYALYMIDWCQERGIDTTSLGLKNIITAGEPGGGEPLIRERIEGAFNCKVRESMGIGDISLSTWAEDDDGKGMHFMARGFAHVELIEPQTGKPVPWEHEAEGELVYTALRHESMPLLRFRSRDHVIINTEPNPTGRTGPRIRCIGRTDDMLIVRGVNLFPTAIRSILNEFKPDVGEVFQIRPRTLGISQTPPLPVVIELGQGVTTPPDRLKERLMELIRSRLYVSTDIRFVSYGQLPRETYKYKLVDYGDAVSEAS
jgi:phenylacetate-CoA ligase